MPLEKVSYRSPEVARAAAQMEAKYGLPEGLLRDIITKGEKTDNERVSPVGARGVAQVMPTTRRGVLDQIGVDAFASLENNVEAAAYVLKQSLDRNKGDVTRSVAEYHGGLDPKQHGPVNRAYVTRVTGKNSTYAQAKAERQQVEEGPSIAKTYAAYKAGKMTADDAKAFEGLVRTGQIVLPRGATVQPAAKASAMPAGAIEAYNSHSDMTDAERDTLDTAIRTGEVALPKGVKLARPDPRTAGDRLGMGVRNIAEGGGALVDIVAAPLNATVNAVAGTNLSTTPGRDAGAMVSDALNLAKPGTPGEKLAGSIIEGATQGLATAGLAAPLAGARGATGVIAQNLSAAPVVDTIASGAATGAQEAARQAGADPLVQFGAALAAGGAAGAGVSGAARKLAPAVAERIGPKAAKVIEETPAEVLVDEAGELTEEGVEAAVRAKAEPQEFKAAVAELRAATNDNATQARAADQYPPQDVAVGQSEFVDTMTPRRRGSQEPPEAVAPVRGPDVAPAPAQAAPEAPGGPAAARVAEAQELGVDLSKGEATQDFATQAAENDLAGLDTPEGQRVRDFKGKQAGQIKASVDKFVSAFGDHSLTATERGAAVKDGLRDLFDQGKAGVTAAYEQARSLADQLGDNAKGLTRLDTDALRGGIRELLIDETIPEQTRKGLTQIAAKFGIIGEAPKHIEATGNTTVMVRDSEGNLVRGPSFPGLVEPLDLTNAERFRQRISDLYDKMANRNPQEALKGTLDEAVEAAAERAAREGFGDVGAAFKGARDLFKAQKKTFASGDVIEKLIAWKKGTQTEAINPEDIFRVVYGQGPESLTNLRKLKAVLLSGGSEKAQAAWRAVQAHAVAGIFDKAIVTNARLGEAGEAAISGAKLNSEIARFGPEKLRLLLSDAEFNELMKMKRVFSDATVHLPRTTNPSGSGHLVARFFGNLATTVAPVGKMVPFARDVIQGVEEFGAKRATQRTIRDVEGFTPEAAAKSDTKTAAPKRDPVKAIRAFIDLAKTDRLIAPLVAATAAETDD